MKKKILLLPALAALLIACGDPTASITTSSSTDTSSESTTSSSSSDPSSSSSSSGVDSSSSSIPEPSIGIEGVPSTAEVGTAITAVAVIENCEGEVTWDLPETHLEVTDSSTPNAKNIVFKKAGQVVVKASIGDISQSVTVTVTPSPISEQSMRVEGNYTIGTTINGAKIGVQVTDNGTWNLSARTGLIAHEGAMYSYDSTLKYDESDISDIGTLEEYKAKINIKTAMLKGAWELRDMDQSRYIDANGAGSDAVIEIISLLVGPIGAVDSVIYSPGSNGTWFEGLNETGDVIATYIFSSIGETTLNVEPVYVPFIDGGEAGPGDGTGEDF